MGFILIISMIFILTFLFNIISFSYTKLFKKKSMFFEISLNILNTIYSLVTIWILYCGILPLKDVFKSFIHDKSVVFVLSSCIIMFSFLFINTYKSPFFMKAILILSSILLGITTYNFIMYLPYKEYEIILFKLDPNFVMPAPLSNFIANYIVSISLIMIVLLNLKNIFAK